MSSNFSVEQQDGITTIRLKRRMSVEEFIQLLDDVLSSEVSDRRLWDATQNFNFSAEEIRQIAAHARTLLPRATRVAFVAADDLTFGQIRMFEAFRDPQDFQSRVFRDEPSALAWLRGAEDL